MKTIPAVLIHVALVSSVGFTSSLQANPWPKEAKESELAAALEPWVQTSTIDSAKMTEENCIHIERNASVRLVNGLHWMPQLGGNRGVLVIHPFSPKRPALIEFPVKPEDGGKFLKIVARGSDHEPGGKLTFSDGNQLLGEGEINSEWVEAGAFIPPGAKMITISWHARGWFNEMLWVDRVEALQSKPEDL